MLTNPGDVELGTVNADAVRARIRRGTLEAVKCEGEWSVHLPHDAGQDTDATQPDTDRAETALIDQLQSENAYLRDRLSDVIRQAASERERADVLQREALQRLEALTPGVGDRQRGTQEAVGSPETIATSEDYSIHVDDGHNDTSSIWERMGRWLQGKRA